MSAWIVSKAHIDVLVQALGKRELLECSPDEAGQILWDENYRSIRARYGDTEHAPPYAYVQPIEAWDHHELMHELACYDYQTCESGDYEETEAYGLVGSLQAALEREGASRNGDIGPRTAPWGVPDCGHKHGSWEACTAKEEHADA